MEGGIEKIEGKNGKSRITDNDLDEEQKQSFVLTQKHLEEVEAETKNK